MTHKCQPRGCGIAEIFSAPATAAGFLTVAQIFLYNGETERAHAMLVLSYRAKADEIARDKARLKAIGSAIEELEHTLGQPTTFGKHNPAWSV